MKLLQIALPSLFCVALVGCWGGSDDAGNATKTPPVAERGAKVKAKAEKAPEAAPAEAAPRPTLKAPNILFVVWDTVRADRTSLYGYDKPTTPLTAAWADEHGVVYDRAVSPHVWTLPSHASMFTALPGRTHGVDAGHIRLEERFTTFVQVLEAIGYDTYSFCANPYIMQNSGLMRGFQQKDRPWGEAWSDAVQAHIQSKLVEKDESTPVSPSWKGGPGNNRYLYKEAGPVATDALFQWIDERPEQDRPWFAFVNLMEAHIPRIPRLASRQAVMEPAVIERSYKVLQTTEHFHEWMAGKRTYDELDLAAISGVYDASLIDLDAATHTMFERLQSEGLADNTIVVLTSDHGEQLGENDLLLHKYSVQSALSRVPLVISWPGHLEPGRNANLTSVSDALPIAFELGDVPIPEAVKKQIEDRPAPVQDMVVTEFNAVAPHSLRKLFKKHPDVDRTPFSRTWIGGELDQFKFVQGSDGTKKYFDMSKDPLETNDLGVANDEKLQELKMALHRWKKAVPKYKKAAGDGADEGMDPELKEALKGLGYVTD